MDKKLLAIAAAAAMMLAGCSSSTPAQKEQKKEEKAVEKEEKQVAKEEKKQDIKEDVIEGILSDLQKDGYEIDRERTEDGITNAKIYSADKGSIDYEFFIFDNDENAKIGMQTLYDNALHDKDADTQIAFTDDKTQIEEKDSKDNETSLYVLNSNVIVKGTVPSSDVSNMKEQFITWGFLYGEQVTDEDIASTEKSGQTTPDTTKVEKILADLSEQGYEIEYEQHEDGITNAKIYSADKGNTDYEFYVFGSEQDAKAGMQTLYDHASYDKDYDTDLSINNDKTRIEETDKEDRESTLYIRRKNTILKGTTFTSDLAAMEDQLNAWEV